MQLAPRANFLHRLLIASAMTFATCSSAMALVLEETPLFLQSGVKPNLLIAIDDSGSMDSEVIMVTSTAASATPTNDGALWWHVGTTTSGTPTSTGSFTGWDDSDTYSSTSFVINYNKTGTGTSPWRKYVNLFPNGYSATYNGQRVYSNAQQHFAVPPTDEHAYTRSPEYNKNYFNPDIVYKPWVRADGTSYPDADPKNALYDPEQLVAGTLDLTAVAAYSGADDDYKFYFYPGMKDTDNTSIITAEGAKAMSYFPASYYRPVGTADKTGFLPANVLAKGLTPAGVTMALYEIKSTNFDSTTTNYSKAIQNFANWFTYYRKRHTAARGAIGLALKDIKGIRTDTFAINKLPTNVSMLDMDVAADKTTLYSKIYKAVGSGGTPNRRAVDFAGKQYMRTDSAAPIQQACQQNYTVLLTDGFSNVESMGVGNQDLSEPAPYTDKFSNTMADIAMKYYNTPLRTDAGFPAGQVPSNSFDANKDLHMVVFGIGLGIKGRIFGNTHFKTADALANAPTWLNPTTVRDPVQVDDLYHATINSRGELLKADSPQQVESKMSVVFGSVQQRTSSAAAVGMNSGVLTADSHVYQARFNSGLWFGELRSIGLDLYGSLNKNPDGTLKVDWEAGGLLATKVKTSGATTRQILTRIPADPTAGTLAAGKAFRWAQLSSGQQAYLNTDPVLGGADTHGEKRLNYLRGDTAQEAATANPLFRDRSGYTLGDIIHSSPAFVGKPSRHYPDDAAYPNTLELPTATHAQFALANTARTKVVYVGANDGMLHAFRASDGQELFAYVPNKIFPKLNQLTSVDYLHTYFVDLSPTVGDAFFGGAWHTMVVGGLGGGGKGYFALDVTDPDKITEATASTAVKWEFTDTDDADLGYTFSEVAIAKLNNNKWAAIFGNGYNSATEVAALFIVDIETGSLIKKITVPASTPLSANGLSTPALLDTNGDDKVDFAYAGDLHGNLWKFDLESITDTGWGIKYSPTPLFTTADKTAGGKPQPITQKPSVYPHPDSQTGYMVYFGTGKYLEKTDNTVTGAQQQTFYGVWDKNEAALTTFTRANLQSQTLTTSSNIRTITSNPVDWTTQYGWYVDLDSGEKSVTDSTLRATAGDAPRVIFTTLIPSTLPCDFGGSGYLLEFNAKTGGAFGKAILDTNKDGKIDASDSNIAGYDPGIGILPKVAIIEVTTAGVKYDSKIATGSKEGGAISILNLGGPSGGGPGGPAAPGVRRSWRQLR